MYTKRTIGSTHSSGFTLSENPLYDGSGEGEKEQPSSTHMSTVLILLILLFLVGIENNWFTPEDLTEAGYKLRVEMMN